MQILSPAHKVFFISGMLRINPKSYFLAGIS